jgi:hypothetical protein
MIYVIGDSHSQIFDAKNTEPYYEVFKKSFKTKWLEAATAYNVNKHIPEVMTWLSNNQIDKENDSLLFILGEIDARVHLGPQSHKQGITYEESCKLCTDKYHVFLSHFKHEGFKIIVMGATPSGPHNARNGDGSLSYKTPIERNQLTEIFNKQVKDICDNEGFIYRDVNDKITKGKHPYQTYFGVVSVHLNTGYFLTSSKGESCNAILHETFKDLI